MMERLLKPEDVFNKLDPHRVAEEIREPLIRSVEDITREVAAEYQPGLWEAAPESVKRLVIQRIQHEAPHMVEQIMEDIKSNITRVFDLKDLVINALVRDKELLNRVFWKPATWSSSSFAIPEFILALPSVLFRRWCGPLPTTFG